MNSESNKPDHDKSTENSTEDTTKKPTLPPIQQLTNGQVFDHNRVVSQEENQLNMSNTTGNRSLNDSSSSESFSDQLRLRLQLQQHPIMHVQPIHSSPLNKLHTSHNPQLLPIQELQQQQLQQHQHHQQQQHPQLQQYSFPQQNLEFHHQQSQQQIHHLSSPTITSSPSSSASGKPKLMKKYFCKICSQGFTRKHNMVSHELIHSSLKPHVCKVCNSRFRRIHDLKRHEKLHTGEKPYICSKCSKRFARPDALTRHQNSTNACTGLSGPSLRSVIDSSGDNSSSRTSNPKPGESSDTVLAPREGYSSQNISGVTTDSSSDSQKKRYGGDNTNPRPPLPTHSISLPPQLHTQTPYNDPHNHSRIPLQHSHSTPASVPPPPLPPIPAGTLPQKQLHQPHQLPLIPHFAQHDQTSPRSRSPGMRAPPPAPPVLVSQQGHFHHQVPQPPPPPPPTQFQSHPLQPHHQHHISHHQELIGSGPPPGSQPGPPGSRSTPPPPPPPLYIQRQSNLPQHLYIPYPQNSYQPPAAIAIPNFQPQPRSLVSAPPQHLVSAPPQHLGYGNHPAPVLSTTTLQHSQSAPPPPPGPHRISSISASSSLQSLEAPQRGGTATVPLGDGYNRAYGIQPGTSDQQTYPSRNQGSQQPLHSPRAQYHGGSPPQKVLPSVLNPNHREKGASGENPNRQVINGYFDQPTSGNYPPPPPPHQQQPPQTGIQYAKIDGNVLGYSGAEEPSHGQQQQQQQYPGQVLLHESGQYIPYSKYQELYKYTQSLQDTLAELNNRIDNLEKKDVEKDKSKD